LKLNFIETIGWIVSFVLQLSKAVKAVVGASVQAARKLHSLVPESNPFALT
jgi:hypothetical protein